MEEMGVPGASTPGPGAAVLGGEGLASVTGPGGLPAPVSLSWSGSQEGIMDIGLAGGAPASHVSLAQGSGVPRRPERPLGSLLFSGPPTAKLL